MPALPQQFSDVSSVFSILEHLLNSNVRRRRIVFCLGAALIGCYSVITFVQRSRGRRRLACIRERKLISAGRRKADLQRNLSAGADQSSREAILRLPYPALCKRLQSGDLTPAQVLDAYQWRALRVDRDLNCVNEVIPEASDITTSLPRGRLFGIPISVKEGIPIEGLDATGGNTSSALRPKDRSAVIIRAILTEGAVPFVQTNMAQGGRGVDCNNALFGETLNPHDPRRSPGGSSGGEAALIAAGGSILGLGSDIGGSIRIPASLCGIFGFKPTAERISHRDLASGPLSRLRVVQTSYGPLSRDLEAAVDLVRVLCSDTVFKMDPMKPCQHFSEYTFAPVDHKRLTIGFYCRLDDPKLLPVTPAVSRAIETAVMALKSRGHRVVPWSPPRAVDAVLLTIQAYALDGGRGFMRSTRRELLTPDLVARRRILGRGYAARTVFGHLVSWLQSPIAGRQILATRGPRSVDQLLQWCGTADAYRQEFLEAWETASLDALICPVLPMGAALPCGETHALRMAQIYAQIYNFLDCPAGSVPVTRVNAEDLHLLRNDYPDHDSLLRRLIRSQAGSEGLPVSVQVVSAPWHDEVCLRAMKELRDGLRAA